jgi:hypothetical protein
MELTDENQDDMDCRPPRETGIPLTPRLQKILDDRKAKKKALPSEKPMAGAGAGAGAGAAKSLSPGPRKAERFAK